MQGNNVLETPVFENPEIEYEEPTLSARWTYEASTVNIKSQTEQEYTVHIKTANQGRIHTL